MPKTDSVDTPDSNPSNTSAKSMTSLHLSTTQKQGMIDALVERKKADTEIEFTKQKQALERVFTAVETNTPLSILDSAVFTADTFQTIRNQATF